MPDDDPIGAVLDRVAPSTRSSSIDTPLGELLHHLRLDGVFYCRSHLSAPWGLYLPPLPDCIWFHVVTDGQLHLRGDDGSLHTLGAGEVALFPHGSGHAAFDDPRSATPTVFDVPHDYISRQYALLEYGGGGVAATAICGVLHVGQPAARRLLGALPDLIRSDCGAGSAATAEGVVPDILRIVADEARTPRLAGEAIITRLSDVLVVSTIRSWLDAEEHRTTGWLAAMRDPALGRALAMVHRDPARDWTVGSLAREVGVSRSTLSARFTEVIDQPPKRYITAWRMQVALDLLRDSDRSLRQISGELGYQSEAAFSRAFTREMGASPSAARRTERRGSSTHLLPERDLDAPTEARITEIVRAATI